MRLIVIFSILFVLSLMVACGPKVRHNDTTLVIPSQILPYIESFEASSRVYGKNVVVKNLIIELVSSNELESGQLGVCIRQGSKTPRIVINESFWENASVWDRRELIFHELGHCVLNLPHFETGIMNPYHIGPMYYNENTFFILDRQIFLK